MGILSDRQIKKVVESGKLTIDPFESEQVQPASYDLRIATKILVSPVSPEKLGRVVVLTKEKPTYNILSGQMVGVLSHEKLDIPLELCARFGIRSYFARLGINAFGGLQLDPWFRGRLTLNLLNVGPEPVPLRLNDLLFSIEFERLDEPAEMPYSGPYQDQEDFPEDQYNFIIQAHTTSLAEIPTLRMEVSRLSNLLEEFEELLPDLDEGLELRPEIVDRLKKSRSLPSSSLISLDEMQRRISSEQVWGFRDEMGELQFDPDALSGIPRFEREQLLDKVQWIWVNRRMIDHHPLRHDLTGLYKRQKGKYRIIYSYDDNPDEMIILLAGTRDTIYSEAIKKLR